MIVFRIGLCGRQVELGRIINALVQIIDRILGALRQRMRYSTTLAKPDAPKFQITKVCKVTSMTAVIYIRLRL